MWILKTLLFLVFLIAVTYFVTLNGATWVDVRLTDSGPPHEVHLMFLLFQAFVVGAVVWFLATVSHEIVFRRTIRKLRQENADLLQEVAGLRNISLDGIDAEKPPSDGR
ncbi:MAG: LapA family protein [Candidatus Eisenbacteria bacterium]|nr:LapA family protein [Candidatus Eisenbacteria bacterium]